MYVASASQYLLRRREKEGSQKIVFAPTIWIFTWFKGYKIKSALSFKIFSTLWGIILKPNIDILWTFIHTSLHYVSFHVTLNQRWESSYIPKLPVMILKFKEFRYVFDYFYTRCRLFISLNCPLMICLFFYSNFKREKINSFLS